MCDKNMGRCENCGGIFTNEELRSGFCDGCTCVCANCEERFLYTKNCGIYCDVCDGECDGECEECGEVKRVCYNEEHGITMCDDCFSNDFSECENCPATYRHEMNGIYCEACEEELTCKECDVCDEDVKDGLCRDCARDKPKKLKTKKLKIVCDHKWECGCEKEICENCIENGEEDEICECDNENCYMYYQYRNDNCTCRGKNCPYCN